MRRSGMSVRRWSSWKPVSCTSWRTSTMSDTPPRGTPRVPPSFADRVGTEAERKLKAQRNPAQVWFGLGMMGIVGWSVAVPTLLGAALGIWLDKHHPGKHAWTLALLVGGLM